MRISARISHQSDSITIASIIAAAFLVKTFLRFYQIASHYLGKKLYVFVALNLLAVATEAVGFLLVIPLLNNLAIFEGSTDQISSKMNELCRMLSLTPSVSTILLCLAGVFIVKGIVVFTISTYLRRALNFVRYDMRENLLKKLEQVRFLYLLQKTTGYFGHLLASDIDRASWTLNTFSRSIAAMLSTLLLVSFAIVLQPRLTIIIIAAVVLNIAILRIAATHAKRCSTEQSKIGARLNESFLELFQSFKYLKATNMFQAAAKRSRKANTQLVQTEHHLSAADAAVEAIPEPLLVTLIAATFYYQVVVQSGPVAPFVAALGLLYRCFIEFCTFQTYWQAACCSSGGLENIYTVETELWNHREASVRGTEKVPNFGGPLEIRNLSFSYDNEKVLNNASCSIPPRTSVGFIGRSGAGKSTLAALLTGILQPQGGDVLLDGTSLGELRLSRYRSKIGFVPQEAPIFRDTIANNISMTFGNALDASETAQLQRVAALSHCLEFIEKLPQGFNTVIEERGQSLSAGQRQRIAIARELFRNPEILILDEATSNLDRVSEECVIESLQALRGTMTIVLITHRTACLSCVDLVYRIDEGKIVPDDVHSTMLVSNQRKAVTH